MKSLTLTIVALCDTAYDAHTLQSRFFAAVPGQWDFGVKAKLVSSSVKIVSADRASVCEMQQDDGIHSFEAAE